MSAPDRARTDPGGGGLGFRPTRWSVVRDAAGHDTGAREAFGALCEQYWLPLYAYARRRGHADADAQDLVQGFLATLMEKGGPAGADPAKGRFRSYLLGAFRHFESHERERAGTARRGGGRRAFSLDPRHTGSRIGYEPRDDETPERAFDRAWALSLLDAARRRLEREYQRRGKGDLFRRLRPFVGGGGAEPHYAELAARLGMTEVALKVSVHRLRRRFGELLRETVRETLSPDPEEGAEEREIQELLDAL